MTVVAGRREGAGKPPVVVARMKEADLPFLRSLWRIPEVMRYANEFSGLRHWSRASGGDRAWRVYRKWQRELGPAYVQLIVRLPDGTPIGESFVAPLPEGFRFGWWNKPAETAAVMGDIKLLPTHWGKGLGTAGMKEVVKYVFGRTECDLFVVPPHVEGNPAAVRAYEKAGFVLKYKREGAGHRIMELWRTRFEELY